MHLTILKMENMMKDCINIILKKDLKTFFIPIMVEKLD